MVIDSFKSWLRINQRPPLLMGVLNVTPDSFSDGGNFQNSDLALKHAFKMEDEGADIIDIGGESSRPGSQPISLYEELKRVIPIIEKIRENSDVVISIDTYKSEVAQKAIEAGADIINDISGLRFDKNMVDLASKLNTPVIIMHMLGNPQNMQNNPVYEDVIKDLISFFKKRIEFLINRGLEKQNIILDPGIGFGKSIDDNFTIIRRLNEFSILDCPLLVGPSRKSFIGKTLNVPTDERIEGTSAAVTASIMNGARILRVHDVNEISRVIKITEKICGIS